MNTGIQGKDVYKKITDKISGLEQDRRAVNTELAAVESSIEEDRRERERVFTLLASQFLPDLTAKSITETLPQLRKGVEELFQRKRTEREAIESQITIEEGLREFFNSSLMDVTGQLEEKASERERLLQVVDSTLGSNKDYSELVRRMKELMGQAAMARTKLGEARSEKLQRTDEFTSNPMFGYLLERGYGSPEYKGKFLARILDKWVARVIGYEQAKQRYAHLTGMPAKVEALLADKKHELRSVEEAVGQTDAKTREETGLTAVIEHGRRLYAERMDTFRQIEVSDKRYAALLTRRQELDDEKGTYYDSAVGMLKNYMKSRTILELKELASSTASTEDDTAVTSLEHLEQRINPNREKAKELKQKQQGIAVEIQKLKEVEREFIRKRYDSKNSHFKSGTDIDDLLILGAAALIMNGLSSNHQFQPSYDYGGGRSGGGCASRSYDSVDHDSSMDFGGGMGFGGGFSSHGGF